MTSLIKQFCFDLLIRILKFTGYKIKIVPSAKREKSLHEGIRDIDGLIISIPSIFKVVQVSREERKNAHEDDGHQRDELSSRKNVLDFHRKVCRYAVDCCEKT